MSRAVWAPAPRRTVRGGSYTWGGPEQIVDLQNDLTLATPEQKLQQLCNQEKRSVVIEKKNANKRSAAEPFKTSAADFPPLGGTTGKAPDSPVRKAQAARYSSSILMDKDLRQAK